MARAVMRLGAVVPIPLSMEGSALGGPEQVDLHENRTKYFWWHEILPPEYEEKQDGLDIRSIFDSKVLLGLDAIQWRWGESPDKKLTINDWRLGNFPQEIGNLKLSGKVEVDQTPGPRNTTQAAHEQGLAFDLRCKNSKENEKLWNWIAKYYVNFGVKRILNKEESRGANGELDRVHIDFSTAYTRGNGLTVVTTKTMA